MGRRRAYDGKDLWKGKFRMIRVEKPQTRQTESGESDVDRLQLEMEYVTTFDCITVYL